MNAILAGLLNGIFVSAVLAFVVGVTLLLLPARILNSATRYAIWWIVLAVTVALPMSHFRLVRSTNVPPTVVSRAVAIRTVHATEPRPDTPALKYDVRTLPASEPAPRFPSLTFPLTLAAGPWPARIVTVWLIAALLMLIRLGCSAILLERRKTRAIDAPTIRGVRVVISSEISIPLVAGPWRRCIMLPAQLLDELDDRELEQIGIHEAAHLLRSDDYALLVQRIVESIFALHPVVRWISRRIDLEREVACDDLVIASTGDPQPYAACLARVVQLTGGIRATPVATSAADRSHLARRVDLLLDQTRHLGTHLLGMRLAFATVGVAAMSWGAVQIPGLISFAAPARAEHPPQVIAQAPPALLAQATPPAIPAAPRPVPGPGTTEPPAPVLVPIVVRDPLGRFVTGLGRGVFKLTEDGVEQVTSKLADSDDRADLFVAVGAEVTPDSAIQPLLEEKVEGNWSADVVRVHGFGQLEPRTPPLTVIRMMEKRTRYISQRQAFLIVTNSAEATEHYTDADLQSVAGIDMPVYVLDLSGTSPFFKELALRTGGDYIPVKQQQEIPDLLAKTVIAVLNEYVLTYTPKNTARDGAYRNLQVTLEQPRGLPPLTVHYRAGYNAPAQ